MTLLSRKPKRRLAPGTHRSGYLVVPPRFENSADVIEQSRGFVAEACPVEFEELEPEMIS